MNNIGIGLILMLVGMCTVFLVLLIIVYLGGLLIKLVNKYFPENEEKSTKTVSNLQQKNISSSKLAAIAAVVNVVTEGKGTISKIEKQ